MHEDNKPSFITQLREGYEKSKRPIAFIIMFFIVGSEALPPSILPKNISEHVVYTAALFLGFIILQVLFEIYEKVTVDKGVIQIVSSEELLKKVHALASDEKALSIKYIGIAGRFGWTTVISRFLDPNSDYNLSGKKLDISVALLSPEYQMDKSSVYTRFTHSTVGTKEEVLRAINSGVTGQKIRLSLYEHMPNVIGFLVNDNYLFLTFSRWGEHHGQFTLRGGGSDTYFVYDKNDEFGGSEMIEMFNGWFQYCMIHEQDNISSINSSSDS
ncbi:hypothetical protein [Shewanella sp. 30m-9]